MLDFDSWHKEHITLKELPTFYYVVTTCDTKLLSNSLKRYYDNLYEFENKEKLTDEQALIATEHIIAEFKKSDVIPSNEFVLIGDERIEQDLLDLYNFEINLEAYLYEAKYLHMYNKYAQEAPMLKPTDSKPEYTYEEYDHCPYNGYAFSLTSWEEALGYRIWIPERFPDISRYDIIASVVWEITFFGSDYETHAVETEKTTASLEQSTKEIDEAIENGTLDEISKPLDSYKHFKRTPEEEAFNHYMFDLGFAIQHNLDYRRLYDILELAKRLGQM